ncbi:MFS transporter [Saccharomonospora xinjiangensis]|uniref:Arabinose efflux permease family protein n=1 Tax=Saccharomonospora xinjiangensis XJ-54 TaxID=882086 RepID=I0V1S3_9PSEU|nr:MFS transporter [Saccharomonospora xinjiangensis]EID54076.1 arabinose efflux permease family protein [Saccharomonospora xinjiangensis XJ-54]
MLRTASRIGASSSPWPEPGLRADFHRYLAARVVTVAGGLICVVVLPVLTYRLTGSAGWTSAVAAAEALPYLVFGLAAGAVADRIPRRAVLIAADLLAAALLASLAIAWWADVLTAAHVLAVGFAVQSLFVFADAAGFAALTTLVGRERLTDAYSTVFSATAITEIAVPPLVGLAVAVVAPAPLLALNALLAVASALLLRAVVRPLSVKRAGERSSHAPRQGGRVGTSAGAVVADVRAGLAFVARHPVVRVLTLTGATHAAAGGAWVALLVPFADHALGIAPSGDVRLAVLLTCWGVGGVLAGKVTPRLVTRFGHARLALAGLPCSLTFALATALSPHWIVAAVSVACWGLSHSVVVVGAVTYRALLSPDDMQARVNTTGRMLAWGVGHPAGAALAGAVAVTGAGVRGGLLAACALLAAGVVIAWSSSSLRSRTASPSHH